MLGVAQNASECKVSVNLPMGRLLMLACYFIWWSASILPLGLTASEVCQGNAFCMQAVNCLGGLYTQLRDRAAPS